MSEEKKNINERDYPLLVLANIIVNDHDRAKTLGINFYTEEGKNYASASFTKIDNPHNLFKNTGSGGAYFIPMADIESVLKNTDSAIMEQAREYTRARGANALMKALVTVSDSSSVKSPKKLALLLRNIMAGTRTATTNLMEDVAINDVRGIEKLTRYLHAHMNTNPNVRVSPKTDSDLYRDVLGALAMFGATLPHDIEKDLSRNMDIREAIENLLDMAELSIAEPPPVPEKKEPEAETETEYKPDQDADDKPFDSAVLLPGDSNPFRGREIFEQLAQEKNWEIDSLGVGKCTVKRNPGETEKQLIDILHDIMDELGLKRSKHQDPEDKHYQLHTLLEDAILRLPIGEIKRLSGKQNLYYAQNDKEQYITKDEYRIEKAQENEAKKDAFILLAELACRHPACLASKGISCGTSSINIKLSPLIESGQTNHLIEGFACVGTWLQSKGKPTYKIQMLNDGLTAPVVELQDILRVYGEGNCVTLIKKIAHEMLNSWLEKMLLSDGGADLNKCRQIAQNVIELSSSEKWKEELCAEYVAHLCDGGRYDQMPLPSVHTPKREDKQLFIDALDAFDQMKTSGLDTVEHRLAKSSNYVLREAFREWRKPPGAGAGAARAT